MTVLQQYSRQIWTKAFQLVLDNVSSYSIKQIEDNSSTFTTISKNNAAFNMYGYQKGKYLNKYETNF